MSERVVKIGEEHRVVFDIQGKKYGLKPMTPESLILAFTDIPKAVIDKLGQNQKMQIMNEVLESFAKKK